MLRWLRLWKNWASLELASQMAYKWNFFLKFFGAITFGVIGPLIAILIYTNSKGIPGWSFEQFLLLTGLFALASGLSAFFSMPMTFHTIEKVREGDYDVDLVRPMRPLSYALATSTDLDQLAEILVGISVIAYVMPKLGLQLAAANIAASLLLLLMAVVFFLSLNIIIAAFAFLFVKTYALIDLFYEVAKVGKNPITAYGKTGSLLLTYVFPVGLAAFYPAQALFGVLSLAEILKLSLIALGFLAFAITLWELGIRKYQSAGG